MVCGCCTVTVSVVPELPEVETLRRQLHPLIAGAGIVDVVADPSSKYAGAVAAVGAHVTGLSRRGKYLQVLLDDDRELVVHLGVTGQLHWEREPVDHVRVTLSTTAGRLWFRDPRRFGRMAVVSRGSYTDFPTLARLGPDPLDPGFDPEEAARALSVGTSPVKARLLDQRALAGVGNYLCDESLWRAKLNPADRQVSVEHARTLVAAVVKVMAESLAHGGVSTRDYRHLDGSSGGFAPHLVCYGRAGQPCHRCGVLYVKGTVAGRGTTWCPQCQPLRS